MANTNGSSQLIDVDELAKEKVQEIEESINGSADNLKNDATVNSWLSVLKQIITAADLHRTNAKSDKSSDDTKAKKEIDESIYADYADDNEQFNAIDLTEQFASNSVKWTIRVKAFKLVHQLIQMLNNHNHSPVRPASTKSPILRHLSDLIRLSFVAATSPYDDLKLQGFEMFKFLIVVFAKTEEREFPGHSILDQYRTQVLSALKPAFNIDAPPYITAIASQVCCLWICHGLEKERPSLKRVYQLMLTTIDKLENQNVNQNSKLYTESELEQERLDILGSWAQLYITANDQEETFTKRHGGSSLCKFDTQYLSELVQPYTHSLVDKWWAALKDYALLIMPSPKVISTAHGNDHVYTKEVALRLFRPIWGKLILASSLWLCSPRLKDDDSYSCNNNISTPDSSKTHSSANLNCDSSYKCEIRVVRGKYFKFISGILMKEFWRITSPEELDSSPEATILSLRSLMTLVKNDEIKTVFINDIQISQEFYTILYHILTTTTLGRKQEQSIKNLMNLIFTLVTTSYLEKPNMIQYSLALLVDLLKGDLRTIEEAMNDKKTEKLETYRTNLSLRMCNVMIILEVAPQLIIQRDDLKNYVIELMNTILNFKEDHSIRLDLLNHLKALYSHAEYDKISFLIEGLYTTKLTVITAYLKKKNEERNASSTGCLDAYVKSYRQDISYSSSELRTKLIMPYFNALIEVISTFHSTLDDDISNITPKRDILDIAIKQVKELNNAYLDEYKDLYTSNIAKLVDSAEHRLEEEKKNENRVRLDAQPSRKLPPTKQAKTKIVLKADFSNFYAKKS